MRVLPTWSVENIPLYHALYEFIRGLDLSTFFSKRYISTMYITKSFYLIFKFECTCNNLASTISTVYSCTEPSIWAYDVILRDMYLTDCSYVTFSHQRTSQEEGHHGVDRVNFWHIDQGGAVSSYG